jgi:hypothetical protein
VPDWEAIPQRPAILPAWLEAVHQGYEATHCVSAPIGVHSATAKLAQLARLSGYRFVLRELTHARHARRGGRLSLAMSWSNVGSAGFIANSRWNYTWSIPKVAWRSGRARVSMHAPGGREITGAWKSWRSRSV